MVFRPDRINVTLRLCILVKCYTFVSLRLRSFVYIKCASQDVHQFNALSQNSHFAHTLRHNHTNTYIYISAYTHAENVIR